MQRVTSFHLMSPVRWWWRESQWGHSLSIEFFSKYLWKNGAHSCHSCVSIILWPAAQLLCFLLPSCSAKPSWISGRYDGIKNRRGPFLSCGCNNCRFFLFTTIHSSSCAREKSGKMWNLNRSHRTQKFLNANHIVCSTARWRLDLTVSSAVQLVNVGMQPSVQEECV